MEEPMSPEAGEIARALVIDEEDRRERLARYKHRLWAATVVAVAALATLLGCALLAPERLPYVLGPAAVLGGVAVSVLSGTRHEAGRDG